MFAVCFCELHFAIYKIDCINEKDTNYTKNISCFLRTISRGVNALTSLSDLVVPLNLINANIAVHEKSSANTYASTIINNTFEVCTMMKGKGVPLFKFALPLISKFAPGFIHPCPYEGRKVGVENFPIDVSLLPLIQFSQIPIGHYRVDVNFYDKYWNTIHWFKVYAALQPKRFTKKHSNNPNKVPSATDAPDDE
ncbi:CLUMA_CG001067, isoform A [Clunio marinus]|uniref:CLUMA_CG001067, isoform A n=1 Tax=Clunio marinus TaxID=568069 RepID=A0A1J1HM14_9DIPT|nr:CLUMA_CG001067, isoform A [Clunio marinus]